MTLHTFLQVSWHELQAAPVLSVIATTELGRPTSGGTTHNEQETNNIIAVDFLYPDKEGKLLPNSHVLCVVRTAYDVR